MPPHEAAGVGGDRGGDRHRRISNAGAVVGSCGGGGCRGGGWSSPSNGGTSVIVQAGADTTTVAVAANGSASATFTVPAGTPTGPYDVLVLDVAGGIIARSSFAVTPPSTAKISLSPARVVPGSKVKLKASGLTGGATLQAFTDPAGAPLATLRVPATGKLGATLSLPRSCPPACAGVVPITFVQNVGGIATVVAIVPITLGWDWPMGGADPTRSATAVWENTITPANIASLAPAWTVHAGTAPVSNPIAVNGKIWVSVAPSSGSAHLVGFGESSGTKLVDTVAHASILASDGSRLFGLSGGTATAYKLTGSTIWSKSTLGTVAEGTDLLVQGSTVHVFIGAKYAAFSATTGFNYLDSYIAGAGVTGTAASTSLFYKTSAEQFDAFKLANAVNVWAFDEATAKPVVVGSRVFAIQQTSPVAIVARDAASGAQLWRKPIADASKLSNLVAMGGKLYAVADGTTLVTINPSTGALTAATLDVTGNSASPVELVGANGVLVLTTGNGAFAIDASSGAVRYANHDAAWIHALVASGRVVLESKDAQLTSLKPA